MRKINLVQGSPEWILWRKTLITASDASSIMGVNPYTSAIMCWKRKLGLVKEQEVTPAMQRGSNLESVAREAFIKEYNMPMVPYVVESSEYNYLGASLDGISPCDKILLEIKCNSEGRHNAAKEGHIIDSHMAQMQHQLLVTGAQLCYYYSFDGENGLAIPVKPDERWFVEYLIKSWEFWTCVVFEEQPLRKEKTKKE